MMYRISVLRKVYILRMCMVCIKIEAIKPKLEHGEIEWNVRLFYVYSFFSSRAFFYVRVFVERKSECVWWRQKSEKSYQVQYDYKDSGSEFICLANFFFVFCHLKGKSEWKPISLMLSPRIVLRWRRICLFNGIRLFSVFKIYAYHFFFFFYNEPRGLSLFRNVNVFIKSCKSYVEI